jgi:uncharacterized Fe-S cluster-containing radical SAM superfamily enzyme
MVATVHTTRFGEPFGRSTSVTVKVVRSGRVEGSSVGDRIIAAKEERGRAAVKDFAATTTETHQETSSTSSTHE